MQIDDFISPVSGQPQAYRPRLSRQGGQNHDQILPTREEPPLSLTAEIFLPENLARRGTPAASNRALLPGADRSRTNVPSSRRNMGMLKSIPFGLFSSCRTMTRRGSPSKGAWTIQFSAASSPVPMYRL